MAQQERGPQEEVVVRLASMPQIISVESVTTRAAAGGAGATGAVNGGAGGGAGGAGGGAELGRRLLLAARAGDTPQVLDLMAQGAPFTTDWLGTSALHLAAQGGHAGTCAVLLRAGVSRDARTKVERTPLHLAAHAGHVAVAAVLLDHGALLDCRDMLRMTPLHWACARGHAALAALLARRGADLRARCKFRRTPLQLAARHPPALRALRHAETCRAVRALPPAPGPEPEPQPQPQPQPPEPNADNEARGAALLRQHGITLLPPDDGGTVLSALQSGRTVVLSDAGKLMLKENSAPATPPVASCVPPATSATSTTSATSATSTTSGTSAGARTGVVVRACPARGPPRPGVKVFTVNQLPDARKDVQIKYVQLPPDATILSPTKAAMKAKSKIARAAPVSAGGERPGVKIIMNKASFGKLLATATRAHCAGDNEPLTLGAGAEGGEGAEGEAVVCVPEQFVRSSSARYLRAQLLAAHAALAQLQRQLRQTRAALAAQQAGDAARLA